MRRDIAIWGRLFVGPNGWTAVSINGGGRTATVLATALPSRKRCLSPIAHFCAERKAGGGLTAMVTQLNRQPAQGGIWDATVSAFIAGCVAGGVAYG